MLQYGFLLSGVQRAQTLPIYSTKSYLYHRLKPQICSYIHLTSIVRPKTELKLSTSTIANPSFKKSYDQGNKPNPNIWRRQASSRATTNATFATNSVLKKENAAKIVSSLKLDYDPIHQQQSSSSRLNDTQVSSLSHETRQQPSSPSPPQQQQQPYVEISQQTENPIGNGNSNGTSKGTVKKFVVRKREPKTLSKTTTATVTATVTAATTPTAKTISASSVDDTSVPLSTSSSAAAKPTSVFRMADSVMVSEKAIKNITTGITAATSRTNSSKTKKWVNTRANTADHVMMTGNPLNSAAVSNDPSESSQRTEVVAATMTDTSASIDNINTNTDIQSHSINFIATTATTVSSETENTEIKNDFVKLHVHQVTTKEEAERVVQVLRQDQYKDHIWACDTEVADIDLKNVGPVGNGRVICFSIFGGPDVHFDESAGSTSVSTAATSAGEVMTKERHVEGKALWVDTCDLSNGVMDVFQSWFEDNNVKKVWHNYGFDRHVMYNHQVDCRGFHGDTMHMARLWDTSRDKLSGGEGYSLEELSKQLVAPVYDKTFEKTDMKDIFGQSMHYLVH